MLIDARCKWCCFCFSQKLHWKTGASRQRPTTVIWMREKSPHSCFFCVVTKSFWTFKGYNNCLVSHPFIPPFIHPPTIYHCLCSARVRVRVRILDIYAIQVNIYAQRTVWAGAGPFKQQTCTIHSSGPATGALLMLSESSTLKTENTAASAARRDRCANSELKCHQSRSVAQLQISRLLSGYVSLFFNRLSY